MNFWLLDDAARSCKVRFGEAALRRWRSRRTAGQGRLRSIATLGGGPQAAAAPHDRFEPMMVIAYFGISEKIGASVLRVRFLRKLILIAMAAPMTILAFVIGLVLVQDFPFRLADLNEDGLVSPREFINSLNLGYRPETGREGLCAEIFLLKDGMPVKVVCEEE